ncbi:macro domain-containing protein [Adlercreutzia sp. ZJ141]|uniref:macro domain-containing protein n=1 Tax=Adlercreutzia sp. ZJ141 TaxID=2709406 RepID=UPI0013EA9BFF|nr:macro domain-containing protein [Adlercreutzia sp. ZJ141]
MTFVLAVLTVSGTAMTITGQSLATLLPGFSWWVYLLIIIGLAAVLLLLISVVLVWLTRHGIRVKVGSNTVVIEEGDLFACEGWKVVPFSEFFVTRVDDVIISRNSLNGIFIERYVENLQELETSLLKSDGGPFDRNIDASVPRRERSHELGCVKRYEGEYLLLAFTRFDEFEQDYLSMADYEKCLMNMWQEISRTYAGKRVNQPLLGGGITRFPDSKEKSYDELLRCMLCTLRSTGCNLRAPIHIVLAEGKLKEINLYELKGRF